MVDEPTTSPGVRRPGRHAAVTLTGLLDVMYIA
jgi:hypothetical protein